MWDPRCAILCIGRLWHKAMMFPKVMMAKNVEYILLPIVLRWMWPQVLRTSRWLVLVVLVVLVLVIGLWLTASVLGIHLIERSTVHSVKEFLEAFLL